MGGVSTPVRELLVLSDEALRDCITQTAAQRYGRWRYALGLDAFSGGVGMDFGCGTGVEGLQLALGGMRVCSADINSANLACAARVTAVFGVAHRLAGLRVVRDTAPFWIPLHEPLDLWLASGVVHHIPYARELMAWVAGQMRPGGEARLLLYSDRNFAFYGNDWERFVRGMDPVGEYADWYDRDKLSALVVPLWRVVDFEYLPPPLDYAVARLVRAS